MSVRLDIGLIVFNNTKGAPYAPFEYPIILRDGIAPTKQDESLFLGLGAVCDVLLLAKDATQHERRKVQRAYCTLNPSTRNGQLGGLQWFGEVRPPASYGSIFGIYTAATIGLADGHSAQAPGGVKTLKVNLLDLTENDTQAIASNLSSLRWAVKAIALALGGLDDTRHFMPWLSGVGLRGDKMASPRCGYVKEFASLIKEDLCKNGQEEVPVYAANTGGLDSEATDKADRVCVNYVDQCVNGTQMDRVYLCRATALSGH